MAMNHFLARHWVGGAQDYKRVGEWQFDWIKENIKQNVRFLDLGCGSLRLGKHLIPWLGTDSYIGIDLNQEIIDIALENEFDNPQILRLKLPQFIVNENFDLSKIEKPVDAVWAYALFIHLNDDNVKLALTNAKEKLSDDGVIYSTFLANHEGKKNPEHDYVYSGNSQLTWIRTKEDVEKIYQEVGLSLELCCHTIKNQWLFKSKCI